MSAMRWTCIALAAAALGVAAPQTAVAAEGTTTSAAATATFSLATAPAQPAATYGTSALNPFNSAGVGCPPGLCLVQFIMSTGVAQGTYTYIDARDHIRKIYAWYACTKRTCTVLGAGHPPPGGFSIGMLIQGPNISVIWHN
jgi:hypothetical protein